MRPAIDPAALAGFTAGEGCFTVTGSPPSFSFVVGLGATDAGMCQAFRDFLGVGTLHWYPRRKPHFDDEAKFQVRKLSDLVGVVVPFMDEHLPPSYKRLQYLDWRAQLLEYWEHQARRPRVRQTPCTVDGCPNLQRARGLCRHHYYKAGFG